MERTQPDIVYPPAFEGDKLRYYIHNLGGIDYPVYGNLVYHFVSTKVIKISRLRHLNNVNQKNSYRKNTLNELLIYKLYLYHFISSYKLINTKNILVHPLFLIFVTSFNKQKKIKEYLDEKNIIFATPTFFSVH